MTPRLLVVGAGGLLGQAVLEVRPRAQVPPTVPWRDPAAADAVLREWISLQPPGPVRVLWCAGGGFVGVTDESMRCETDLLAGFLDALGESGLDVRAVGFASSAGGVYAGRGDLVDETTPPAPTSAYGRGKLAQEEVVTAWARARGVPVSIARYANLYGPGQDLSKPQGLVTNLVKAALLGRALNIFVPLDTRRDYVFSRDAAAVAIGLLETRDPDPAVTKIVASGRTVTITELVALVSRITRRRCPVTQVTTGLTAAQPPSLSFRSVVRTDLDSGATTLVEGVSAVVRDLVGRQAAGGRAALGA